ncbi:protein S100-A12-like [Suncus etruscus]|uniref:protein S100-A12-like n=1 Tax=Suncus etruscus TaxID=109475 RepID=UPI00210FAADB|nr:protein S100-A12-like [Suncus etruscus]
MTKFEDYLEGIVNIYHQYSVRVGHADTLSKGELGQLITREMANILKQSKDQSSIDKIFQDLDADRDAQVNFEEFVNLVFTVLLTTHDNLHKPC